MKYILSPIASPGVCREIEADDDDTALNLASIEADAWEDYVQFKLHRRVYNHLYSNAEDSFGAHKDVGVAILDTETGLSMDIST